MGYDWQEWALRALRGIQPYEVMQVLTEGRRWPKPAIGGTGGLPVLTIWGRTRSGRALIVVTLTIDEWNSVIVGAREMNADELAAFGDWEAGK